MWIDVNDMWSEILYVYVCVKESEIVWITLKSVIDIHVEWHDLSMTMKSVIGICIGQSEYWSDQWYMNRNEQ